MKKTYPKTQMGEIDKIYNTLSKKNQGFIDKFLDLKKGSITNGHLNHLRTSLIKVANLLEKDFDKVTREDMKIANNIMLESVKDKKIMMSPRTIQDDVCAVKEMYKELWGEGEEYPKVIRNLIRPKTKGLLKIPKDLLTEKQVYEAIKKCNNSRDKCLIAVMGLDSAMRKIEAQNIKLGDIGKDKHGYYIIVKTAKESGDTSERVIRIIKSEPYLVKWLNDYPKEKSDDDYLFITLSSHKQITTGSIDALFKGLKEKLGFNFYPKLLRHSLLTQMSKNPRVAIPLLKKFAGHSKNSRVIGEYQHFGDDDVKDMQLKYNGMVKEKEEQEQSIKPIKCPKCKKSNDYDNEVCDYCGMALNQSRQVENFKEAQEFKEYLPILEKLKEAIEKQQKSKRKDVFEVMEL